MKKSLSLFFVVAAFTMWLPDFLFSQQPERCATMLYNKLKEQKNPTLAKERSRLNEAVEKILKEKKYKSTRSTVIIPVVVHVVYRINIENIPDAQIHSQIDVLNEDYGRTNADASLTPSVWNSIAANTDIQFCLASRKPNGDWTNGIERRQCTNTEWQPNDEMKYYTTGGLDAWDPNSYLNIWVCNLVSPFLGYTTLGMTPIDTLSDGAVILSRAFGRVGFVSPPFDKGRTTTHEIGHWLGLYHTFGDDNGSCLGSDYIDDTPNQGDFTQGCPVFPVYDACSYPGCDSTDDPANPCSSYGIMFMNYMDYAYDNCMNLFTQGQSDKMHLTLDSNRATIYTSLGCSAPAGVGEIIAGHNLSVYPNPTHNEIYFSCSETTGEKISLSVCDVTGKEILRMNNFFCTNPSSVNISSLDAGVYFLKLTGKNVSSAARFLLLR